MRMPTNRGCEREHHRLPSHLEETCAFCLSSATTIDGAFRKKQQLHGLEYAVTSPVVTFNGDSGGVRQIWVEGDLSQVGGQVLDASGAVVQTFTTTPAFRVLWQVRPGSTPVIFGSDNL